MTFSNFFCLEEETVAVFQKSVLLYPGYDSSWDLEVCIKRMCAHLIKLCMHYKEEIWWDLIHIPYKI